MPEPAQAGGQQAAQAEVDDGGGGLPGPLPAAPPVTTRTATNQAWASGG